MVLDKENDQLLDIVNRKWQGSTYQSYQTNEDSKLSTALITRNLPRLTVIILDQGYTVACNRRCLELDVMRILVRSRRIRLNKLLS